MIYERLASVSLIVLLALGTIGFIVFAEPEQTQPVSSDGVLSVATSTRASQPVVITEGEDLAPPLIGKSYLVTPENIQLDHPAILRFSLPAEQTSESLAIFRYQPEFMMWEEIPLITLSTNLELAVEVATLGTFAVGERQRVTAPDFLTVKDELLTLAPEATVGYEMAVGYATQENGPRIRLPKLSETGGCGGQMQLGDGEEQSTVTRQAQVPLNDALTPLTFVFVGSWITSSQAGCGELAPLGPFVPML